MPSTQCCVPLCKERGGHRFPRSESRRKEWAVAIRRATSNTKINWTPTESSVVCCKHFKPSDYYDAPYLGGERQAKRLKPDAVPSVFVWTMETASMRRRQERLAKFNSNRNLLPEIEDKDTSAEVPCVGEEIEVTYENSDESPMVTDIPEVQKQDVGCDPMPQGKDPTVISVERLKKSPTLVHNFTGLQDFQKFMFVFDSLGPAAHELNYMYGPVSGNISVLNRFLLVLVKMRKNYSNQDLSLFFGISQSDVYNIICTWACFMYAQWRELDIWPERDVVHFYSPSDFHDKFPATRVTVDGTENPIRKPKNTTAQQATYSTYKNRNTMKVLVGVTPGGLCSYVSQAYGGSTSDRQIVERSNLMQMCDPGDDVMADKGFDVQDIFAPYGVLINIPTFFRKTNRMTTDTVKRDRKISKKRVHVERFIGLAKTYKILKEPMNSSETLLSTHIIFICFTLCNFRSCIVPTDA